jgi:ABC-2 type transport system ATP-binding protein
MSAPTNFECALETQKLTRRFGRQLAVDQLTLRIPSRTVFGFLGPNGAGKTTTIKMLMRMLPIHWGSATVLGTDVASGFQTVKHRIGYVPELHFIYRWMRVEQVIRFCGALYPTWSDERCTELLRLFDLDPRKKVKQLSKGMLAKLGLLVATAHNPELLILDEPTSGLDPLVREEFLDGVLRTVCDRETTVLFSSHALTDVQRVADRIGIICAGRLLFEGRTDSVLTQTKRIRAILDDGCTPAAPPEGTIWQRCDRREWQLTVRNFSRGTVDALRSRNPVTNVEVFDLSLEEIFKDYVRGAQSPC